MAHFTKATSVKDWLNQRLAIDTVEKVMMTEYWIPKNINFLWAMGMVLVITFALLLVSGI
ncbi:MAG: cytochrome bc complex cytochrome b subunit, partial [Campylobacterota bacterium]|nr:cytochrome bc complex cytochrome b subunit [Campylobacterota bacterium]